MEERKQAGIKAESAAASSGRKPPMSRPPVAPAQMTPKEIYGVLRRHLSLIVLLTVLGLVVGGVGWILLLKYAPKYTAQTYIKVLSPAEKDPLSIGSALVQKNLLYDYRSSIAALITARNTLQDLVARDKIQATQWFKSFGKIQDVRIQKAVKDLEKHFRALAQRDGDFVIVRMTCGDAEESALIVNEMINLFLASRSVVEKRDVTARLKALREQQDAVQQDLNYANQALDDIRNTTGIIDLEQRYYEDTITLRLNNLEIQKNNLMLEIKQLQSLITTLEAQATGPINEQVERQVEVDPVMILLAQQLSAQESVLASRLTKFGENHRVVQQTQELINSTKRERALRKAVIAEQVRQANLKNAKDRLTVLQGRLEELHQLRTEAQAKKADLERARAQYERAKNIRDERRNRLDEIKASIEKLEVLLQSPETAKVQFVAPALVPLDVSSPKWYFYFPGGTVLGLMLAVGLAFLLELLNDLVRTPSDVSRYLHIPLLGIIPDAAEDDDVSGVDLCHVVDEAPYSVISESYRRLRTNLRLSQAGRSAKVILVSSSMPGEGGTSTAANLAMTLVLESTKVLLIDANFRKPHLQMAFPRAAGANSDQMRTYGLSTLLKGLCSYQDAKRASTLDGLDIIDAGQVPSNPTELLGSPQMQQFLDDRRKEYDYIVIDGPPTLLVSDTKILASFVDGTILVFNAGMTSRGAALRTIRELRQVNAKVIGCVLFAVKAMKGGYFEKQFRSYQQYQKAQPAHSG